MPLGYDYILEFHKPDVCQGYIGIAEDFGSFNGFSV